MRPVLFYLLINENIIQATTIIDNKAEIIFFIFIISP